MGIIPKLQFKNIFIIRDCLFEMAQFSALNVSIVDGERARIRVAFKNKTGLVIQLTNNQNINGRRDNLAVNTRLERKVNA